MAERSRVLGDSVAAYRLIVLRCILEGVEHPGWEPARLLNTWLCLFFSCCYQFCSLISFPLATSEGYLSSQSSAIHLPVIP